MVCVIIEAMSTRTATRLAWGIGAISLSSFVAALFLQSLNRSALGVEDAEPWIIDIGFVLLFMAFTTVGALIASRSPINSIGWIFCVLGISGSLTSLCGEYAVYALATRPGLLPQGDVAAWLSVWLSGSNLVTLIVLLFLLFPNGRSLSPRWRPVAWLTIIANALSFALYLRPGPLDGFSPLSVANPLGIKGADTVLSIVATIGFGLTLVAAIASVTSLVLRFRRAQGVERLQMKWLTFAGSAVGATFLVAPILWSIPELSETVWSALFLCSVLSIPISVGIAILKYRLYDIDIIINRTLVYGTLTVSIIGLYVLGVGGLSRLMQTQSNLAVSIFTLLIVAAVVQPLHRSLQRGLNRLMRFEQNQPADPSVALKSPETELSQPSEETIPAPMNPENSSSTILRGRWLILARAAWLAMGAWAVGLFVAGIPAEYTQLQLGCPTPSCASSGGVAPVELSLLENLGLSPEFFATYGIALELIFALVFIGVAALIFWQKSSDRLALFAASTLLLFGTATQPYAMQIFAATHPSWRLPIDSLHFLGSASFSLFLYIFPDGRFVPRWTRWVALLWIAWLFPRYWFPDWPPSSLGLPNLVIWLSALGTAIYSQVHRFRNVSDRVQRQQTKWVVFGIALGLALFIIVNIAVSSTMPVPASAGDLKMLMVGAALMNGALLLIPLSIGVAVLRYHLFDIDILINRTLVYGTLIVIVTGLYIILVGMVGVLFQSVDNSFLVILATGLIAVLFQPLRQRLQRGINHFMYGERDDPYAVLSRLGQRLEATLAPEAVLPTLVETIAQSLKLPYAGITLNQEGEFRIATEFGRSQGEPIRLLLIYRGEPVGELLLAPRAPGDVFTPAERRLLDDLARQAGIAVHAVRLTTDLQRSRERLVTTREEERRRLRRDLHDGLGPQLASLTLKLETARNRLTDDPLADSLLADLAKRTQDATADIRRLVYGLRPPTLDELGLVSALREVTTLYSQQGFNGVHITIGAPEDLPPLPAAVEVAVYRITQEALTNVVRHAEAHVCNVRITLDEQTGWLCLEIQDDGRGLSSTRRAGIGLNSMRERAEELGGTWTIESLPTGGTRILVQLPFRLPDELASSTPEEK